MTNFIALTRRELGVYFVSPMAYIILTVMLLASGVVFVGTMKEFAESQLPVNYEPTIYWLMMLVVFGLFGSKCFSLRTDLVAQLLQIAPLFLQIVVELFFLLFEPDTALHQTLLFFAERCLLCDDRGCLNAQGVALGCVIRDYVRRHCDGIHPTAPLRAI